MQGYSLRETAAMIGIALSTLYVLMKQKKAPRVTKVGNRSIIFKCHLEEWLAEQTSK